ncbi:arsenate reductase (glutaredoxin) [Herbaspirillum sp. GCM10030257]|uniref:arsenate reductase (glutaredoxin) n=1 Tax=Herbaspirillum sp. GCM10030257 TaxID=3273393 RepID=UPI00361BC7BA
MSITIYHNRRCSKSREALERVTHFASLHHQEVNVVDYLDTPLNFTQLQALQRQLGASARDLVRTNEEEYMTLRLDQADEHALLQALAATPKLLQRPIVVVNEKAIIARPPELLDTFLSAS